MITLSILAILLALINCEFDPYRERLDLKELEEKILLKLSQDKNLNRRKLSQGVPKYINPTSTLTFGNEYIFEVFSVRIKAQKGEIHSLYLPRIYDYTIILWYNMGIKNENEEIVPLDTHVNNCSIDEYNNIVINTNLAENYELYVKIKMRHDVQSITDNILLQKIVIYVPPIFGDTKCKYLFKSDSNSVIVGLVYDKFEQINSNTYIYDDNCPTSSEYYDLLRLTPYQVTWNIYNEITMSVIENPKAGYIKFQKAYFGGNNYNFTKNELLTSIKENDTLKIDKYYELTFRNFQEKEKYFKLNLTFSSSHTFWNVTAGDFKNTSNDEALTLAKSILENDKSSKPDYYKIGKWVYTYIKYNISYSGKILSISDIISIKQGVCTHYTLLYNSLLNSIGIEAAYASGYAVTDLDYPNDGTHAWTVAKIDGKWIGLDATWGIFSGYLPLCHIFKAFNIYIFVNDSTEGKVNFNKKEEIKLLEIINFTCDLPYIDINRSCKLCKEIDDKYPYYDFNSGECVSKCSKVTYKGICYDNCNQLDSKNRYEKNGNNECKLVSDSSYIYINIKNTLFLFFLFYYFKY